MFHISKKQKKTRQNYVSFIKKKRKINLFLRLLFIIRSISVNLSSKAFILSSNDARLSPLTGVTGDKDSPKISVAVVGQQTLPADGGDIKASLLADASPPLLNNGDKSEPDDERVCNNT